MGRLSVNPRGAGPAGVGGLGDQITVPSGMAAFLGTMTIPSRM